VMRSLILVISSPYLISQSIATRPGDWNRGNLCEAGPSGWASGRSLRRL